MKIKLIIYILLTQKICVAQTVDKGIFWDTLSTIQNEDFIVNTAVIVYSLSDSYDKYHLGGVSFSLIAKKNITIQPMYIVIGCDTIANYKNNIEYLPNERMNCKILNEYFYYSKDVPLWIGSTKELRLLCKPSSTSKIRKAVTIVYSTGKKTKSIIIYKFKFIEGTYLPHYRLFRKQFFEQNKNIK